MSSTVVTLNNRLLSVPVAAAPEARRPAPPPPAFLDARRQVGLPLLQRQLQLPLLHGGAPGLFQAAGVIDEGLLVAPFLTHARRPPLLLAALGDLAQRRRPPRHEVPHGERAGRVGRAAEGMRGVQQRDGHVDDALRAERARPAELQRRHLPPAPASGAGAHERAHHDAREAEDGVRAEAQAPGAAHLHGDRGRVGAQEGVVHAEQEAVVPRGGAAAGAVHGRAQLVRRVRPRHGVGAHPAPEPAPVQVLRRDDGDLEEVRRGRQQVVAVRPSARRHRAGWSRGARWARGET